MSPPNNGIQVQVSAPTELFGPAQTSSSSVSQTHRTSEDIWSSVGKESEAATDHTEDSREDRDADTNKDIPLGLYSMDSVYSRSETSSLPAPRDLKYITDLAGELYNAIKTTASDQQTLGRVAEMLPNSLRAFALKVGYQAHSSLQLDVYYFIRKHRKSVGLISYELDVC